MTERKEERRAGHVVLVDGRSPLFEAPPVAPEDHPAHLGVNEPDADLPDLPAVRPGPHVPRVWRTANEAGRLVQAPRRLVLQAAGQDEQLVAGGGGVAVDERLGAGTIPPRKPERMRSWPPWSSSVGPDRRLFDLPEESAEALGHARGEDRSDAVDASASPTRRHPACRGDSIVSTTASASGSTRPRNVTRREARSPSRATARGRSTTRAKRAAHPARRPSVPSSQ